MSDVTIRPARLSDQTALTALFELCYATLLAPFYEPGILATALPFITKAQPRLLQSGTFYVADHPQVGLVSCGGWSDDRPGSDDVQAGLAHIRHFATHPRWTGRGLAKSILACCLNEARARDVQRFECQSTLAAAGFYRAAGFAPVQPIDVPLPGIAFPAILMRLELNS